MKNRIIKNALTILIASGMILPSSVATVNAKKSTSKTKTVTITFGKNKKTKAKSLKKDKKRNSKFIFKVNSAPSTIKYYAPGIAANADVEDPTYNSENSTWRYKGKNVTSAARKDRGEKNILKMTVKDKKKVRITSSNAKVLKPVKAKYWHGKENAVYALIPYRAGKATIKVEYPGGSYKKKIAVSPSKVYKKINGFVNEVNKTSLDDAQKAFLIAGYQSKLMSYDRSLKECWHGIYDDIVSGKGVCDDYARCYCYLTTLANIKSRYILSKDNKHAFNQVLIEGKWYNVDVTGVDNAFKSYFDESHFLKSTKKFAEMRSDDGEHVLTTVNELHVPDEKKYITTSTKYDNYDWTTFSKSNTLAQKYGIKTVEEMFSDESEPNENQAQEPTIQQPVTGSDSSAKESASIAETDKNTEETTNDKYKKSEESLQKLIDEGINPAIVERVKQKMIEAGSLPAE